MKCPHSAIEQNKKKEKKKEESLIDRLLTYPSKATLVTQIGDACKFRDDPFCFRGDVRRTNRRKWLTTPQASVMTRFSSFLSGGPASPNAVGDAPIPPRRVDELPTRKGRRRRVRSVSATRGDSVYNRRTREARTIRRVVLLTVCRHDRR